MNARIVLLAAISLSLGRGPAVRAADHLTADSPSADALAVVNAWGMDYAENRIVSYITGSAPVFEFPNGQRAEVGLPEHRMTMAIAPYNRKTPCAAYITHRAAKGNPPTCPCG